MQPARHYEIVPILLLVLRLIKRLEQMYHRRRAIGQREHGHDERHRQRDSLLGFVVLYIVALHARPKKLANLKKSFNISSFLKRNY